MFLGGSLLLLLHLLVDKVGSYFRRRSAVVIIYFVSTPIAPCPVTFLVPMLVASAETVRGALGRLVSLGLLV